MEKATTWKNLDLSKERVNFAGALHAHLETGEHGHFVSLTFKTKDGQVVRIRKHDYSVAIETPVVPTERVFIAKIGNISMGFKTEEEAKKALGDLEGEVFEKDEPIVQKAIPDDLPF